MNTLKITFLSLILALTGQVFGQVAINGDGSAPDGSAMLEILSSDRGILIPRLSENEKNYNIVSPATGLLIYQNDGATGFYYFDGVIWKAISGLTSVSATTPLTSSGGTSPDIALTIPLTVASGGTGLTAINTGSILYGAGGAAIATATNFVKTGTGVGVSTSNPNSLLHVNGSFATGYVAKTGNYTAGLTDQCIAASGSTTTITLPTAVGIQGRIYTIKCVGSYAVTVATTLGQTIDGSTTYSLSAQYKYISVISNNAHWLIIANN
jgi:hypothetical protein